MRLPFLKDKNPRLGATEAGATSVVVDNRSVIASESENNTNEADMSRNF